MEDEKIIERIAQRVFEKLREGVFRLPPSAVEWLKPFIGYMPMPVQLGHGRSYCMLETRITREGGVYIMLRTPEGDMLWDGTLIP